MFRWDNIGATSIRLEGVGAANICRLEGVGATGIRLEGGGTDSAPALHALLDACAIPIVVHDYCRAAILGNATLIQHRGRYFLLTAAHLFDNAPRCGNWLAPAREDGALLSLEGALARRPIDQLRHLDLALIDLRHVKALPRLLRGRHALSLDEAAPPPRGRGRGETVYAVSGFPAAWSRFERGWLAAKRLTVLTRRSRDPHQRARHDRVYDYGHLAQASSGAWIHTPALEGMSGAGIWALRPGEGGRHHARLAAVQSAFVHSRYLRGYDVQAALPLLLESDARAA
jgi:hypothetical protein